MEKEEMIQLLKDYKENKAERLIKLKQLKNKRMALKHCDDLETTITSSTGINQDIQSKNKISNKVLDRIERNDNTRRELEKEIEELETRVKELTDKTEAVSDRLEALRYKEKQILSAYYIEGRTYEDIGNNLYLQLFSQTRSEKQVKRIVEKALDKMLKF